MFTVHLDGNQWGIITTFFQIITTKKDNKLSKDIERERNVGVICSANDSS